MNKQQQEILDALSTLFVGDRIKLGDDTEVTGVPGGWIFYRTHKAGITSTFVPVPRPAPQLAKTSQLVLPN